MRANFTALLVCELILFAITFLLARPIDVILLPNAKLYPLFYASTLPVTTWVLVPLATYTALFSTRPSYRITSILILAMYTELLPSYMLVNPWLPDQYPYLSEAMWVHLHGRIEDVQYLNEVPALGILYGVIQTMLNIEPFTLSKVFALIQTFTIPLFLALTSKLVMGHESLLPISFIAFNYFKQINVFHRASLHFTYATLFFFLIIFLNNEALKHRAIPLIVILYASMVIAYPGSGYILSLLVISYTCLLYTSPSPRDLSTSRMPSSA